MRIISKLQGGIAGLLASVALAGAGAASAEGVTLEYWVYSDFAAGDALALQQQFIAEFVAKHPGVKINITGKGDDDLTAGEIAGAASNTLPDVFMNGLNVGAQLASVGALSNIYDKWMAMPESFRAQFNADAIKSCTPKPDKMYCLPYTGFGSLLFRNLTVLQKAGVDTSKVPATWTEWFEQMKKVKAAGLYAMPDTTMVFNSVAEIYGTTGDASNWGIDWATHKTRIDPTVMTKVLQKFIDMVPLNSGTSRNDQATKDLFIANQLAFHVVGPWVDPTYKQAAEKNGLKYDFQLVPGDTPDKHGGIKSYEIVGVSPGPHRDLAWEFATYITAKEQMGRWATLLARYNGNAAAMADPKVASQLLITKSVEAVKYAVDVQPPYFVGTVPSCYLATVVDIAAATADGKYTAAAGAKEMISQLNTCLAE
ncbi:MAG: extracellular solute-binding protein [Ancalomicrobiaceae bacterium]|nr:extracellular solute-binding protein [Ancalomicrobiaceae bacterium]